MLTGCISSREVLSLLPVFLFDFLLLFISKRSLYTLGVRLIL
jgi:hypothetical protein